MALDTRIVRSVRRLLRRDATERALRIIGRLTADEVAAMLPSLSPGERSRLEASIGPQGHRPVV